MKSELDRHKEALAIAIDALNAAYDTGKNQIIAVHLAEINSILNPPPEYEEVEEIVGWVNVYRYANMKYHTGEAVYPTMELADESAGDDRLFCQPIKVTVRREKRVPKERSVTVEAHIKGNGLIPFYPFADTAAVGRTVQLTATWQEEP